MIVGDPSRVAIESSCTVFYERLSQRALGYFVVHISGETFGVRSPDATLLACSLDAVRRRLEKKGLHRGENLAELQASDIAESFCRIEYRENHNGSPLVGISDEHFKRIIESNEIVWAPDGDAAFDDGSHILQFDDGDMVRVVAFRNAVNLEEVKKSVREFRQDATEFYGILHQWQQVFEAEWENAAKAMQNVSQEHNR